mgnify:FL=1
MSAPRVLVVGIGNTRHRDEGVGVRAVQALKRAYDLPGGVEAIAVEGPDFDLLDALEEAGHAIFVDCVFAQERPGATFRVPLDELARPADVPDSLHEPSLLEALGVLEMLGRRPSAVLIGVQVGDTSPGLDLSHEVAARLPAIVDEIVHELRLVGVRPVRRADAGERG